MNLNVELQDENPNSNVGLGVKCSKEVATAIRGAIILAKLSIVPIRMGYWGSKFGLPHTVPVKVTGKCGSVRVRLIPAPRGTGIVAAQAPKKLLEFAGLKDVYTSSRGTTRTLGNFVKATFAAVIKTYSYLTPDLWPETQFNSPPYQEYSDLLASKNLKRQRINNLRTCLQLWVVHLLHHHLRCYYRDCKV
eukprot:TRINITY_DN5999_c0_g1_i1.p1 TRINITY_DN5999_c0_g1~~TRINITY_DN5999_c0_g1_i1.p1  ORF type:complete len:191 (-),score=19.83 TRINITY_DN5999_c0_g1_i1:85-657(-)